MNDEQRIRFKVRILYQLVVFFLSVPSPVTPTNSTAELMQQTTGNESKNLQALWGKKTGIFVLHPLHKNFFSPAKYVILNISVKITDWKPRKMRWKDDELEFLINCCSASRNRIFKLTCLHMLATCHMLYI